MPNEDGFLTWEERQAQPAAQARARAAADEASRKRLRAEFRMIGDALMKLINSYASVLGPDSGALPPTFFRLSDAVCGIGMGDGKPEAQPVHIQFRLTEGLSRNVLAVWASGVAVSHEGEFEKFLQLLCNRTDCDVELLDPAKLSTGGRPPKRSLSPSGQ